MHTEESLMALANAYADAWHRDESIVNPRSFKSPGKEEALRLAIREVLQERDEARKSDGWQWVDSARADRVAAVSQWRAVKERAERAEAECERLRKDAERYRWLRDLPEGHPANWICEAPGDMWDAAIDDAMRSGDAR